VHLGAAAKGRLQSGGRPGMLTPARGSNAARLMGRAPRTVLGRPEFRAGGPSSVMAPGRASSATVQHCSRPSARTGH